MRQTRAKALATAGTEEVRASMICRSGGMRLKSRKTRRHRSSRSGPAPGRLLVARERRETITTTMSNLVCLCEGRRREGGRTARTSSTRLR